MTGLPVRRGGLQGAPTLVLLHPIATHAGVWAPQLPVWSRAFDVVALDLPGHGGAPVSPQALDIDGYAQQVLATLDGLGIECFALLGLSFGGMVAQGIALRQPARVRALVLAHTAFVTAPPVAQVWEDRLRPLPQGGMATQVEPTLARWFTPSFLAAAPATAAWVGDMIGGTPEPGYVGAVRAIQQLDHAERLGGIDLPALVIGGEHDTAVPPEVARQLARRLPRATLTMLNCAHLGHVEQPVPFTEAVNAFLKEAVAA